jgi:hypothetical protein
MIREELPSDGGDEGAGLKSEQIAFLIDVVDANGNGYGLGAPRLVLSSLPPPHPNFFLCLSVSLQLLSAALLSLSLSLRSALYASECE